MRKITFFVSALLLTFTTSIFAQKTWTGTTSTAWNTSTNWSPAGAPASTDDVIIPSAPANQPLINGAITPVCKNLTINSGATLSISATSLNNALLTASGNAIINGALSIGGAITKTGKLVVVNITWASTASMSGFLNGSIDVTGNWEFSTGSAISMGYCGVNFIGSTNTQIISKSAGSSFYAVTINKNSGNTVDIASTSTATLNFGSTVTINTGSTLLCHATNTIVISNSLYNTGHFSFGTGTVSFEKTSGTQIIQVNTSDLFNNMIINSGGTVTINNTLNILNDLTINSGIFDPLGNMVILFGDWDNNVGPDSFTEGTSRVIFSGGNYHQYSSTENFNILEVNKSIGGAFRVNTGTVTCNQYDWTAGSIDVLNNGTFTALDLADQGIRGNYYVNTGCTISLYQDASQYVDLGGNLTFTGGGTINVYGGNGTVSQWPTYANASITMDGGTLDFKDQSITINTLSGYSLTSNITGGTIRTSRGFFNNRTDFNPSGGTVELYGSVNSGLDFISGSLWNLEIDKDVASSVTLNTNLTVNGNLTVNSGTITYVNKVLTLANTLNINSGGVFNLGAAGQLKLASGKYLNVNSGGLLKTEGTGADNAIITHSAGYYFISVKNGGTISSKYTFFTYPNYVQLMSGSTLDPANAFYRCTFTNNAPAPLAAVLSFANDQVVSIHEANFVALNSGYNVLKSNDAGHVYFKDATGAFAGATYENDPYNRIDWVASTPGLWTGLASADWFNINNWDDYNVPTATTNVIIPAGTPYSPEIDDDNPSGNYWAYCNDLVIHSDLSLKAGSHLTINGSFDSDDGQFMQELSAYLYFSGSNNASWVDSGNDVYTYIYVVKSTENVNVDATGTFHCKKLIITEGELIINQKLEANNASDVALIVEDGGGLILVWPFSEVDVIGSINLLPGCGISNQGTISCSKDLIVEPGTYLNFIGPIEMNGTGIQYLEILNGDNNEFGITINKPSGICYIKSADLYIYEIHIKSGTLSCNNGPTPTNTYNIYLNFMWRNEVGPSGFDESTGRVIIYSTDWWTVCYGETFNILEINKPEGKYFDASYGEVICAQLDWTSGSIKARNGGTFTANDLLDNAIKGSFICEEGSTINLTNSGTGTYVDLAGELHNFGGTINITGSLSYWPYGGDAVVEMTGGVIDLKTCGLNINNNSYSLNDNITGGTIKTAAYFSGNRADFTPSAGTIELYGTSDSYILQSNGCTINILNINKSADDGMNPLPPVVFDDERNGEMIIEGGKANNISLSSDFLARYINIDNGLLTLNGHTLNVVYDANVYGSLVMNNVADVVNIGQSYLDALRFKNGSLGNLSQGTINCWGWVVPELGCSFSASMNNTVILKGITGGGLTNHEPTAVYGNIVVDKNAGQIAFIDDNATQPIHISGNFALSANNIFSMQNHTMMVNGLLTYVSSSEIRLFDSSKEVKSEGSYYAIKKQDQNDNSVFQPVDSGVKSGNLEIDTDFTLNGLLDIEDGSVLVHGEFSTNSTGSVVINGGSFVADSPNHPDKGWEYLNGNLTMTSGLFEISYNSIQFGNVATTNISGGILRTGGAFFAGNTGTTFNPTGGDVEVIGEINDDAIYCGNGNYFFNLRINRSPGVACYVNWYPVTIKNDLTIQSGILNSNGFDIYIEGDWNNLVGPDGFVEGNNRVVFNGDGIFQYCSTEEFNILEVERPAGWSLWNLPGASISCQQYDWTQGGISLYEANGHFYAADLIDDGIQGYFAVGDNCSIELHQDALQSLDLMANLHITGGEFKVYGGNDQSQWGENGNTSLYMVGGILDFVDQAIVIQDLNPYSFTSNIAGGTIRTRSFIAQSPGFDPTGGTVEIYGDNNGQVVTSNGAYFHNLKINTEPMPFYTNIYSCNINNDLIIEEGSVSVVFGNTMQCGNVIINSGGDLRFNSSTLKMKNNGTININSGGYLNLEGYEGAKSTVTGINPTDHYQFNVNAGSTIYPTYTNFENMSINGIYIASGATVLEWQPFKSCEFRNGATGGTLLNFNNDQNLVIENAVFPTNTWGGSYNVSKSNNAGNVTFLEATGGFAGENFDNDPFNRIHWGELTNYLNLKVWLEGPFNNTDMNTNLTGLANFPLNQPYNVSPWNYAGTESVTIVPGNVVDWVLVELRDAPTAAQATSATRIARQAAFLKKDGSIVGLNGTSLLQFNNSITHQLFVVIWHRNHIEIMSAIPLVKVSETYSYDFRTDVTKAYGAGVGYKDLGAGVAVMVGADGNADGNINNLDKIGQWNPNAGMKGYLSSDFNLDSQVDNKDKNNLWIPNLYEGFNSQVPD